MMPEYEAQNTPGAVLPGENTDPDRAQPLFGTAVILAGGKSSRMGFDKQLLMDNHRPLMESLIQSLKQEFDDILIVTAKPELYAGMSVRVCTDRYRDKGPLAGVHAAMEHARSRYLYLIACDMPVVHLPFICHMKGRLRETGADICACRRNGRMEPFNAFYSRSLLEDAQKRLLTGNSSLFRFIGANRVCEITEEEAAQFDKELGMFTNINTRTEYEKFLGTAEGEEAEVRRLVDKREIVRYINGEYICLRDLMVHEAALQLELPGFPVRTLYCSPMQLKELVVGHLYTQRYIRSLQDIASVEVDEDAPRAVVRLREGAGSREMPALSEGIVFDPKLLLQNQERFYADSTLQKATAGTHRCALCSDAGTHMACIDISRHNALDKLVGKALLEGVALEDKYIITSGRIPMDMILKAAAIGIPMIVSRSTPTIAAVDVARSTGLTLLGFSRENRFNIYSAPHRLKGCTAQIPEESV
ncbi:MAG: formate dehydrogenase accessory sulfurtransferase FdhD [Oscillospiraceae bacterium]|nr:formate dehydrogenase accessory sulfurtransferase FdhD [Oscillospiraceae bacterium]